MALLPTLQKSPDIPSTSVAKAVLVLAQQWLGNAPVENSSPVARHEPSLREQYLAKTVSDLVAMGIARDDAAIIAEVGYATSGFEDVRRAFDLMSEQKQRRAAARLSKAMERLKTAVADYGKLGG